MIAPLTRICAGVIWPVAGALDPPAVRPDAARSCSAIASYRMSVSPSTMNRPLWLSRSVRTVPQALPMSQWPYQPAWFSNWLTVTEYLKPPVSAAPTGATAAAQTAIHRRRCACFIVNPPDIMVDALIILWLAGAVPGAD